MKIVFLDVKTIGEDIDLSGYDRLGQVVKYPFSTPAQVPDRIADADVIVLNKVRIDAETVGDAPKLKLVCVTATGTNNLDKEFLDKRKIAWRNVAGYSTESVAQHTFAMLFYLLEKLRYYDDYVKDGRYACDTSFTHFEEHFYELNDKTWGIIGLGNIGRRVASIAKAFGAHVIYTSPSGSPKQEGYCQVDMDTLLASSDIISVHAPLNKYTENLINAAAFKKMKKSCIFLNLGRGPIVVEDELAEALEQHEIAAAGLDVLCTEPMSPQNPLLQMKDSRRLYITPHIAWASVEARTRLMKIVLGQIHEFFDIKHSN
ncbi:D-2-hydroxyacid dehydrogenase [Lachnospiraceae bacterium WCA-9-b2]|uniref:D-2-hydroxyacid dehydrogenase n=1 Tax=Sporofaciens musculi TaxID=2681861 RepID=A0A7X3MJI1_9FIRM|nr:D-2-hydroxyacid dehydrogenase [Sporofaciens musculi]MXP77583.1 D-2-hydroxyacid dehydrogenase [Sporofaciens musculi]